MTVNIMIANRAADAMPIVRAVWMLFKLQTSFSEAGSERLSYERVVLKWEE
jgi:hypothetical protein